jgi:tRNA-dihydrouridine synthase C
MEGLLDCVLRDVLTRIGGVDRCVSEFIRITNTLLPERAFIRVVPELLNAGRTPAGIPVRPQLLGSDPHCLAGNAARVAGMGCDGVDLNFGCPAKQVNRHGGGAALLQDPEMLYRITRAVRAAVPAHQIISAKMRLGFDHDQQAEECALALEAGGAGEIVIHARTKADGYRPPAYWPRIADIRARVKVPLIANGEIWNVQDAVRARQDSGCHDVMIGRGIVTNPGLALALQEFDRNTNAHVSQESHTQLTWQDMLPHLMNFWELVQKRITRKHQTGRFKQWLNFLRKHFVEAEVAYLTLRTVNDPQLISEWLLLQSNRINVQPFAVPHVPTASSDVAPHHEKSAPQTRDPSSIASLVHSNH